MSMTNKNDIAVSVRGLSKSYTIAHNDAKHTTAGEALMHRLKNPWHKAEKETFWALKDVDFDIQKGDVVGIIGRNGAGKSTLLKILSRITEPTAGEINLYGRVGSLLEVGTGFHAELTGRENIFLNGAILGMNRREIARHFDAIVDFAEVENFLDTPVKRYSSGMYVRLAFAVAAHLNPEILIVDEVLAVGDAEFQKKCLGKMQDVSQQEGRTVLFVSHNMTSVVQLCRQAVFLDTGRLCNYGLTADIVDEYMAAGQDQNAEVVWNLDDAPGDATTTIRAVRVLDSRGQASGNLSISDPVTLEMEYWCHRAGARLNPSFHVLNMHGVCVFATANFHDPEWGSREHQEGLHRTRCIIPSHFLNDGQFKVSAFVVRDMHNIVAQAAECATFHVTDDGSSRGDYTGGWIGSVRPMLPWRTEALERSLR